VQTEGPPPLTPPHKGEGISERLPLGAQRPEPAHFAFSLSLNRWIFPVCVFGSVSVNFNERGYL
jgi:hypothetical protein